MHLSIRCQRWQLCSQRVKNYGSTGRCTSNKSLFILSLYLVVSLHFYTYFSLYLFIISIFTFLRSSTLEKNSLCRIESQEYTPSKKREKKEKCHKKIQANEREQEYVLRKSWWVLLDNYQFKALYLDAFPCGPDFIVHGSAHSSLQGGVGTHCVFLAPIFRVLRNGFNFVRKRYKFFPEAKFYVTFLLFSDYCMFFVCFFVCLFCVFFVCFPIFLCPYLEEPFCFPPIGQRSKPTCPSPAMLFGGLVTWGPDDDFDENQWWVHSPFTDVLPDPLPAITVEEVAAIGVSFQEGLLCINLNGMCDLCANIDVMCIQHLCRQSTAYLPCCLWGIMSWSQASAIDFSSLAMCIRWIQTPKVTNCRRVVHDPSPLRRDSFARRLRCRNVWRSGNGRHGSQPTWWSRCGYRWAVLLAIFSNTHPHTHAHPPLC